MSETPPYGFPAETSNGTGLDPRTSPDPTSVTGAWYTVRGKYGKRKGKPFQPGDRPVWWVMLYHFGKGVAGFLPYLLVAWLAKYLGLGDLLKLLLGVGP